MSIDTLYRSPKPQIWQGRQDNHGQALRFFQFVQCIDVKKNQLPASGYALLGFCSDAGVVRNQGRPGAKDGPQAIRQQLANLPIHSNLVVYDCGDIACQEDALETAQQELGETVALLTNAGLNVVVLGGGHEVAWGHYQGIEKNLGENTLGIVNFDAHYDLRPLIDGTRGSSGTPFLQIAHACGEERFSYCCLGIQTTANTRSLVETATRLKVKTIHADQVHADLQGAQQQLSEFIRKYDSLYVTLCLDVFSHSVAPGVSAPQANGLFPYQVIPLLKFLKTQGKPIYFDIAEMAPCYDRDNHTAKLAAICVLAMLGE